jgi:hypothetical protein
VFESMDAARSGLFIKLMQVRCVYLLVVYGYDKEGICS